MKFRNKPVVIDAVQWAGDNPAAMWALTGRDHFDIIEPEERCDDMDAQVFDEIHGVWIPLAAVFDEIHGVWIPLAAGMWVIKGIKGEFYPCAADVFAETYKSVSE